MSPSIAERLRPFCHLPGVATILPGTHLHVQIFPCLIRIYSQTTLLKEVSIQLIGPVQEFTVCNDLEKGQIIVWGKATNGWIRYALRSDPTQNGVQITIERAPEDGIRIQDQVLHAHDRLILLGKEPFTSFQVPFCERLSLGNHQSQDWELIKRRLDLTEIFPLWHRLGLLIPKASSDSNEGTLALLEACQDSMASNKPESSGQLWLNLFQTGFQSLFVPRLMDTDYQGLALTPNHSDASVPFVLLTEGVRLIRELFVQQTEDGIAILPHLLPEFHCGRFIAVPFKGGILSLEWTKKTIRRLWIQSDCDQELSLHFHSHVKNYRLRESLNEKGKHFSCKSSLILNKNCLYLFDNFT